MVRAVLVGFSMVAATVLVAHPVGAATRPSVGAFVQAGPAATVEQDQPLLPDTNEDTSPPYVMIALTTVLVAGGCLYLLFRRGSLAYRARQDEDRPSES